MQTSIDKKWPPLTDDEIRERGWDPTEAGWVPLKNVATGGEPPAPASGLPATGTHVQGGAPAIVAAVNDADPPVSTTKKPHKQVRPKREARQIRGT